MLGVADIAAIFDVEPKTVSMWRIRYTDFPEPDVIISDLAGWDPGRVEELRVWAKRRPGRGRKAMQTEDARENLRRVFSFSFLRPDDFAWAPIDFLGIEYDADGLLASGMQAKAASHLLDALHRQGYEIDFEDPTIDLAETMRRILWDRWSEDEIGAGEFVGRIFDNRGRIYPGFTAFEAAQRTIQRLACVGGDLHFVHESVPAAQ